MMAARERIEASRLLQLLRVISVGVNGSESDYRRTAASLGAILNE
jgi:hypothetical protein